MTLSMIRDERGVAAMTVLMVTAVLGVAGTVVGFAATAELEIGARDRRAEDAFTAAEAGLDQAAARFVERPTWGAGQTSECLNNALVDDGAEYRDPSTAAICGVSITSSTSGRFFSPPTGRPFVEYTVVSRATDAAGTSRTVAGVYRVEALSIPYGMMINGPVTLGGTPKLLRESLLVNGPVTSRNRLSTDWNANRVLDDPDLGWEFHKDLIRSNPAPGLCTDSSTGRQVGCAAVFSNFQIFSNNVQRNSDEIHAASADPALSAFPHDRDIHQTQFLNNVAQPVVTIPTDAVLEPMEALKRLAEAQGLFFNYRNGRNDTVVIQPADLGASTREFAANVVVYVEADAGDSIGWKTNLIPESTSSDINYTNVSGQRVGSLSGVLVVRGGSLRLESGTQWSGAVFVPENTMRILGGSICTCTIYAQGFSAEGGNATVQLTSEWFTRMPAGLVSVLRTSFQECARYQPSSVCPAA